VVACEIKLFGNSFEIISVFYFICNHRWLLPPTVVTCEIKHWNNLFHTYFSVLFHL